MKFSLARIFTSVTLCEDLEIAPSSKRNANLGLRRTSLLRFEPGKSTESAILEIVLLD